MSIPVLKQGALLIVTLQTGPTDADLLQLRDELAIRVGRERAHGVLIDVTALDVVDSFAARTLRNIVETAKLRGAATVIAGIQPDVALAMVQLGLAFEGVATALDLEEGMRALTTPRSSADGNG